MGETREILAAWHRARARGERVCLATVVRVEGSSYRKPGARMLLTAGGERAGTISGGCLEAEVSRKAWWLTANGPRVERYQSSFDEEDGGIPWGLGCGGTVSVLLEQEPTAVLEALKASVERGEASVVVSRLAPPVGSTAVAREQVRSLPEELQRAAEQAFGERRSFPPGEGADSFVEYLAPPPRLTIFGAGDDAIPIAEFAEALGWRVVVADGRAHLLRPGRFPDPAQLRLLVYDSARSPLACGIGAGVAAGSISAVETGAEPGELAVVLTHSYEQDRALLAALLPKNLLYLGVLGPRHRTSRLLEDAAPTLGWSVEECFARLHSPVGLDLGARDPAAIALAIIAEMQATVTGREVAVVRRAEHPGAVEALAGLHP